MFTGLVEAVGRVKSLQRLGDEMRITIQSLFAMDDCRVGDSMSVNGACLTVTALSEGGLSMDVSAETLSRTTIGTLKVGDEVNLERALRVTDRLGGHLVSGHVDGIGKILKKESRQRSWFVRIGIDEHLSRYTIEKGSVAVDGISLTINRCGQGFFEVNIVPHTAAETTILKKKPGDLVNVETDLIGKYVEKFLSRDPYTDKNKTGSGIDREKLTKYGFGD